MYGAQIVRHATAPRMKPSHTCSNRATDCSALALALSSTTRLILTGACVHATRPCGETLADTYTSTSSGQHATHLLVSILGRRRSGAARGQHQQACAWLRCRRRRHAAAGRALHQHQHLLASVAVAVDRTSEPVCARRVWHSEVVVAAGSLWRQLHPNARVPSRRARAAWQRSSGGSGARSSSSSRRWLACRRQPCARAGC